MKYSQAVAIAKEPLKPSRKELKPLHQCERCKAYDIINQRNSYEWLKPFNGYVQTPLCSICQLELRKGRV